MLLTGLAKWWRCWKPHFWAKQAMARDWGLNMLTVITIYTMILSMASQPVTDLKGTGNSDICEFLCCKDLSDSISRNSRWPSTLDLKITLAHPLAQVSGGIQFHGQAGGLQPLHCQTSKWSGEMAWALWKHGPWQWKRIGLRWHYGNYPGIVIFQCSGSPWWLRSPPCSSRKAKGSIHLQNAHWRILSFNNNTRS